jgi:hypothetical protein
MVITMDAKGYEELGQLMQSGWVEYLKAGPHREPFYPFLVALSMNIADVLAVSYQKIQTYIQILFLLASQLLSLYIFKKLKIQSYIAAAAILYLGLSPAIVNSAFSLYSEIAAYPFVLGIVIMGAKALQSIQNKNVKGSFLYGISIAVLFTFMTFIKGIYAYVMYIFLIPFLFILVKSMFRKNKIPFLNALTVILSVLLVLSSSIVVYKLLNQKYNGHYTFTTRGARALYGSSTRRAEKLTSERFLTALAYIPGEGFCNSLFEAKRCFFWSIHSLDEISYSKIHELGENLSKFEIKRHLIRLSIEKVKERPFQFIFLMGVDGLKMFFWESTKIGFVSYPPWLTNLFNFTPFKNFLRLAISSLCLLGFIHLLFWEIFPSRHKLFNFQFQNNIQMSYCLFIFLIIVGHIGFYSLFMTIPRFAFPIAPLQLITVASTLNHLLSKLN